MEISIIMDKCNLGQHKQKPEEHPNDTIEKEKWLMIKVDTNENTWCSEVKERRERERRREREERTRERRRERVRERREICKRERETERERERDEMRRRDERERREREEREFRQESLDWPELDQWTQTSIEPATTCNMNMPIYIPFSIVSIQINSSKNIILSPTIPLPNAPPNTPGDNYCVLGDIPLSTTKLSGTVRNILKNKSITRVSSEQNKESVECTSLSPTDPQLRPYEVVEGLNKDTVFVKTENKALVCSVAGRYFLPNRVHLWFTSTAFKCHRVSKTPKARETR